MIRKKNVKEECEKRVKTEEGKYYKIIKKVG